MTGVVITTGRLLLREFRDEDLDPLARLLGDPVNMRHYPRAFTREEAWEWITRNRGRYARDGHGLWAVTLRASSEFVGDCGVTWQEVEGARELEVGYHLLPEHQKRGYATEAAGACVAHAFRHLDADRVIALVRPVNAASRRVAERVGMRVAREAEYAGLHHLVYAVTRDEWERRP